MSASKLTAGQAEEQWRSLPRPAWLGEKGLTPAERGIALHDYMQYADFRAAAEDAAKELMRLREKHYLTPEQAEAVDLARVRKFFSGSLGKRVLASQELQKERRFTAEIPASMAGAVGAEDVSVILQGAVDCTFTENESLHIIDFKTDKINTVSELWERYETQIRLYACAMEQVTGLRVGELFLYSTYLSEGSSRSYHEER
ncbi:MAG: PD-(D/E)XK nuclease family protein [Eubacteriales bacterium]